jgi:hypothetical protein
MRDFLIPTFEQFQYLRQLRKAERRKEAEKVATLKNHSVDPPKEACLDPNENENDSRPITTGPLVPSSSQPVSPNQDNFCENNDDDDSATELGTPPAKSRLSLLDEYDNDDDDDDDDSTTDFLFTKKRNQSEIQRDNLEGRRRKDLTEQQIDDASAGAGAGAGVSKQQKTSTKNGSIASEPRHMVDNKKINVMMSPLSTGTVSPLQDSSPDHHHHHHHQERSRLKPWFQRKRKPKLQQTRLSFSGSSA